MYNNDETKHGEVFTTRLGIFNRWNPLKNESYMVSNKYSKFIILKFGHPKYTSLTIFKTLKSCVNISLKGVQLNLKKT